MRQELSSFREYPTIPLLTASYGTELPRKVRNARHIAVQLARSGVAPPEEVRGVISIGRSPRPGDRMLKTMGLRVDLPPLLCLEKCIFRH